MASKFVAATPLHADYPLPDLDDPVMRPFWDGCRDGRLMVQRDRVTGALHWPPKPLYWKDGRRLEWSEFGASDGRPVIAFHGTPSSRLDFAPTDGVARRLGVRVIAPDRPGHGGSSPVRGRTLAGGAADIVELADHLGLDRFAVLGFSGGGPHAFACASQLGDRVSAVVGASAAGPVDQSGGLAGMSTTDRMFTWVSLHAAVVGRTWMRGMALVARGSL